MSISLLHSCCLLMRLAMMAHHRTYCQKWTRIKSLNLAIFNANFKYKKYYTRSLYMPHPRCSSTTLQIVGRKNLNIYNTPWGLWCHTTGQIDRNGRGYKALNYNFGCNMNTIQPAFILYTLNSQWTCTSIKMLARRIKNEHMNKYHGTPEYCYINMCHLILFLWKM